jgi:hypothetical protein
MSVDLAERSADILAHCLYANIATAQDDVPWNTPATVIPDPALTFYWSSWAQAVHSRNIAANPRAFITFYDSTRARGTNNLRCVYLQCEAGEVTSADEAEKAFGLLYPDETVDLSGFMGDGIKRFYRATPKLAWLNSLSEKELAPDTLKMRTEVSLEAIRAALK